MTTSPEFSDAVSAVVAARRLKTTVQTVYRYITTGCRVPGVGIVKLAAVRIGGHYLVRPDAIDLFVAACNPTPTPPPESPAATQRRGIEAKRRLAERLGGGR